MKLLNNAFRRPMVFCPFVLMFPNKKQIINKICIYLPIVIHYNASFDKAD